MMEIQSLFKLDKELLGLILAADNLREIKSKFDKACDIPRDSANAADVFRDTLGVAAKIKAERTAREKKKGGAND